jgi:diguanylate cyclase (GGDEF)-like protein
MSLRHGDRTGLIAIAVSVLLACAGLTVLLRVSAERLLERDAQADAVAWARFFEATVPDLGPLFDTGQLTPRARDVLMRLRNAPSVFRFNLYDPQGRLMLSSRALASPQSPSLGPLVLPGDTLLLEAAQRASALSGKVVVELKHARPGGRQPVVYAEAYVPVERQGRLLGVVEVYVDQTTRQARMQQAFAAVTAGSLLLVLGTAGAVGVQWLRRLRGQRRVEERVQYLVHHDPLSGAMNRVSFHEALLRACARRPPQRFAVLCLDLDHFKEINDTHGHSAGDDVLRQVGERLRALVRDDDCVARLGGDEFAILQSRVADRQDVATLAQRIVQSLSVPYELNGESVAGGVSVGAAIHGVDATDDEGLMHRADLALYRAKSIGRGTFSFYDAALDQDLQHRRALTRDLREALDQGGLSLHFQPLYRAHDQALTGYEALLRWNHPTHGPISPAEFIPLAEASGLIDPIGRWVLLQACAEAATWPAPLTVAVNLSAAQFRAGRLVDTVRTALAQSGLPAHRLELEITESLLMVNTEQVVSALRELSTMGVQIAMDDFGTGYSSLAYLWRFPFNKVKIDRAFTQALDTDPKVDLIVQSIISLAHALKIRVNAEGVETGPQRDALQRLGCDELQGFLLGRPQPVEALAHRQVDQPQTASVSA